jgi:hypothetical protein
MGSFVDGEIAMSLNWNLTKIKNHKNLCWHIAAQDDPGRGIVKGDKVLSGTTETLIFSTMIIGIGKITEKNWREFFSRISLHEAVFGRLRINGKGAPIRFKPEEVKSHIGLECNVVYDSDAKWLKRLYQAHDEQTKRYLVDREHKASEWRKDDEMARTH